MKTFRSPVYHQTYTVPSITKTVLTMQRINYMAENQWVIL